MSKEIEQIEDFLEGRLDAEQDAAFRQELAKDPDLRADVEAHKATLAVFKQERIERKLERIKRWKVDKELAVPVVLPDDPETNIEEQSTTDVQETPVVKMEPKVDRGRPRWLWWSAAATVALLIVAYLVWGQESKPDVLFAENYELPDMLPTASTDEDAIDGGVAALDDHRYRDVIDSLTYIQPGNPAYANAQFLIAHAYLGIDEGAIEDQYSMAIKSFDEVLANYNDLRLFSISEDELSSELISENDIKWYKALSYLKLGDQQLAASIFQDLAEQTAVGEGIIYTPEKARQIADQLK
jgi:hypothetical protein